MKIIQKKTKTMLFNFTNKFQFMTRLSLNGENKEVVSESKLLGKIISNDLTWTSNTTNIVRKTNFRMVLLGKLAEFGAPAAYLKTTLPVVVVAVDRHTNRQTHRLCDY